VLSILFAVFISIFALDVFGEGYGFWGTVVAFLMHMVPTLLVVGAIAVSWKWPLWGGGIFGGLGLFYVLLASSRGHWEWSILIAGPVFVIGCLFILDGIQRQR
jgi:hypothetical protein